MRRRNRYFTNWELDDYENAALTRTPFRDERTGAVSLNTATC
jgi:hypothetical protein